MRAFIFTILFFVSYLGFSQIDTPRFSSKMKKVWSSVFYWNLTNVEIAPNLRNKEISVIYLKIN